MSLQGSSEMEPFAGMEISGFRPPERTFWKSDTVMRQVGYDGYEPVERLTQASEAQAQLASSLCESGLHAPALDIDFPAQLEQLEMPGFSVLVLDKEVRTRKGLFADMPYSDLLYTMADVGLIAPGHARYLVCESATNKAIYPFIVGLEVPARLVPSSSDGHHHLYVDHEMPWKEYAKLLKALHNADIIEKGFLDNGIRRKQTMLRKPGVLKPGVAAAAVLAH